MLTQRLSSCRSKTGFMDSYQGSPEGPHEEVSGHSQVALSQRGHRDFRSNLGLRSPGHREEGLLPG